MGSLPITGNGSRAENRGLEFSSRFLINQNWETSLTYAYTNAELTQDSEGLVGPTTALDGARLPGSPEHQASFNLTYSTNLASGFDLDINYGLVYVGDIYNIVGGDEDPLTVTDEDTGEVVPADRGGEAIDPYDLHHLSATLSNENWKLQAYVDNLFNEYYVNSTRVTRREAFLQTEQRGPGATVNGVTLRSYGEFVGAPRTIGLRLNYFF